MSKKQLDALKIQAEGLNVTLDPAKSFKQAELVAKWDEIWPFLKGVLEYVRDAKLTGNKLDKKIDKIIALGDKVTNSSSLKAFFAEVQKYLKWIRAVIKILIHLTNDKVDAVLNKILAILDWMEEGLDK